MSELEIILHNDLVRIIFGLASAALLLLVLFLIAFLTSHTMFVMGKNSLFHKKTLPTEGWNKRFYPSCITLTIFILALLAFIEHWRY
ncbi:MAG: hypothetical protein PVI21_05390 [Candidatus Woesebacteria bacterium]|jgi:hypothetical protein